jgi:hypothetical protein
LSEVPNSHVDLSKSIDDRRVRTSNKGSIHQSLTVSVILPCSERVQDFSFTYLRLLIWPSTGLHKPMHTFPGSAEASCPNREPSKHNRNGQTITIRKCRILSHRYAVANKSSELERRQEEHR